MTDQVADTKESTDKVKLPPLAKIMLGILLLMTTGTLGAIIYLGLEIAEIAKTL